MSSGLAIWYAFFSFAHPMANALVNIAAAVIVIYWLAQKRRRDDDQVARLVETGQTLGSLVAQTTRHADGA